MRYRTKQRFTEIVIVRDNKLHRAITLQEGDELRFVEEGFEPLTDTPEQPESGEMKQEVPTGGECEHEILHRRYIADKDIEVKECAACLKRWEQPTQEIKPLDLQEAEYEHDVCGYGGEFNVIGLIAAKVNELTAAVNAFQKGNEG